ncbi:TPA: ABC transporter permease [Streptococcus suis]|nr:ABC transporter permease [Streptococcus suis]HEM4052127.1 ABC transporter permease [Streptococcus suis]
MFRMILKDLRVTPLRTFLTGFSMFIGILAMIAAFLVGSIGRELLLSVNAQIAGYTPTYSLSLSELSIDERKGDTLFDSLAEESWALSLSPESTVRFAALSTLSELETNRTALYKQLRNYDTLYVSSKYRQIYNLPLYEGRWFSNEDNLDRFEIVVNKAAANIFTENHVILSEASSLSLTPLNLVGIVNDGKNWPVLYVNIEPIVRRTTLFENSHTGTIYWHTNRQISMEKMQSVIEDTLHDSIGGKVETIIRTDNTDSYASVIDMLQIGLFISSGLLLLVSILGQINIGLASLEYRTHELLIRRALGASKWNIAMQVLGSVILLSIFVCISALALSFILVNSVGMFLPKDSPLTPPLYPYKVAIAVIATSVVTALLGGLIPAVKAAKLEPALALR